MTPLEQIKKEYEEKFSFGTNLYCGNKCNAIYGDNGEATTEEMWNFISQKLLETERKEVEDLKQTIIYLLVKAGGEVTLTTDMLVHLNPYKMIVETRDNIGDNSRTIRVREMSKEELLSQQPKEQHGNN